MALFTFPNEFKMLLKERASGMYRLSAFYFARTASVSSLSLLNLGTVPRDAPRDASVPT